MKVSSVLTIFLLIAAVSMTTVSARAWQVGDNGLSRWDRNCDFNGRDIGTLALLLPAESNAEAFASPTLDVLTTLIQVEPVI